MTETVCRESEAPVVAIIPYGTKLSPRLANMSLDDLSWPIGRPARLQHGTVANMGPNDHIICYVSSQLLYMPRPGVRAQVSVMVVEPEAVHGRNMAWLKVLWWRFFRVLSCNPRLLARLPNGERYLFGSTWVPEYRDLSIEKTSMISLIASGKTYYPGHKLRHQVVAWIREKGVDAEILGRGYAPFDQKSDGLAPYRYSVIIENVREPGYFTEKLIDCLLCETVPIYWGAQDIDQIFEPGGMLICDSLEDIKTAIGTTSEADYRARLEFVAKNKEKAASYANHEEAAARIVQTAARRKTSQS
ncbi:Glycosyltransferase family 10 (fucosyltransferase) [Hoeflea phototrophica DFL-43]|uniref:Glycosyltransferase family 10 (Fucosyltransferase) n=1 Tax=Hoeflea phototrophica (strain DSM 17068 / NCIMB 14078 / DFL-43) TaxID=411684 RepID=A9CXN0_HOEPD|nr:glycosyltransferase family 10 [Hoeflea phototrophica]EDQ35691.2 Glycosyltransferase family 10 (fucosyltransferase) [Hoeflea phototrophica DFL-43]